MGLPLYLQVSRDLDRRIRHGELKTGDRLPTESELSQEYEVNRLTVRQALAGLARSGLISTQQGRGSFVSAPPLRYEIVTGQEASFTAAMTARGHRVAQRLIRRVGEQDPQIAGMLRVQGTLHRFESVRSVDGTPWSLTTTWIAADQFPGLRRMWRGDGSLYEVLKKHYGTSMQRADRSFSAVPAESRDAEHLMVSLGSPILLMRGLNVDQHGQPVTVVEHRFRGDRAIFTVNLD